MEGDELVVFMPIPILLDISPVFKLMLRCAPPGYIPVGCVPSEDGKGLLGLTESPVNCGCAERPMPELWILIGVVVDIGAAYCRGKEEFVPVVWSCARSFHNGFEG